MDELSPIDEQQIRGMALSGAIDQEIADSIGWSVADLVQRFGPVIKQARAARHISLRRKQTAMAIEGSVAMLTFLGRHELGQTDRNGDPDDAQPQMDAKVG
ncbi:MAG: hypothetical protein ABSF29_04520 [Tepidisphaeraceae bacterium]|jgi:hypothetical protein